MSESNEFIRPGIFQRWRCVGHTSDSRRDPAPAPSRPDERTPALCDPSNVGTAQAASSDCSDRSSAPGFLTPTTASIRLVGA